MTERHPRELRAEPCSLGGAQADLPRLRVLGPALSRTPGIPARRFLRTRPAARTLAGEPLGWLLRRRRGPGLADRSPAAQTPGGNPFFISHLCKSQTAIIYNRHISGISVIGQTQRQNIEAQTLRKGGYCHASEEELKFKISKTPHTRIKT